MHNPDQIQENTDIVAAEPKDSDSKRGSNTFFPKTADQDPNALQAADLFAHFTANIIKEERLFIR